MIELMRSYIPHKNWRTRLALNPAASNIWLCWVISFVFLAGLGIGATFRSLDTISTLLLAVVAVASFATSFIFLSEAKRVHAIRVSAKNDAFFRC